MRAVEKIKVPTHVPDVQLDAYLGEPHGDGPFPGVLVVHELYGLDINAREKVERFASEGYVALAPDLYSAAGRFCMIRTLMASIRGKGEAFDYLRSARSWLADRDDVDPRNVGVAGFCMGGGFAVFLATDPEVKAAAPFYGWVPRRTSKLGPLCPVVGGWGGKDVIYRRSADRLGAHLDAIGTPFDIAMYDDAGHAFMNVEGDPAWYATGWPMYAGYEEGAARDSWARVFAFFDTHLKAPPLHE